MGLDKRIGWIGLGKMGLPMAENLAKAGATIQAYNRTASKSEALASRHDNVSSASSPAAAAKGADIVISIASDDDALKAVTVGPDGLLETAKPGTIFVDMSTVSPMVSVEVAGALEEANIEFLRAPVSGSIPVAEAGALKIWCSGPQTALDLARPALEIIGGDIVWLGEDEQARYMKLAINLQIGVATGLLSEALAFGLKGGIEWDQLLDGIDGSPAASPLVKMKIPYLKNHDYDPTFTVDQMGKDLDLALATARAMNAPMPITAGVRQDYTAASAMGKGELDIIALVLLAKQLAGLDGADR